MRYQLTLFRKDRHGENGPTLDNVDVANIDLSPSGLNPTDRWSKGLCPYHEERTPSFSVFWEKPEGVLFYCFGCQAEGEVLSWEKRG